MTKQIKVTVTRYKPEENAQPYEQSFDVPYTDSTSILDALNYIKEEEDSSLSYRWSCRMAICGSCGYMVNNEPKLGCNTFVRDYAQAGEIKIAPLAHFATERDLMIDQDEFVSKLEAVKPYLITDAAANHKAEADAIQKETQEEVKQETFKQTPEQLSLYQQFSACINCGLCYAACPQFGLNPEFLGPGVLALAQRYNLDNRDTGQAERFPIMNTNNGVWSCTFVGYCSDVCPQNVDPAAAVNQGKVFAAENTIKQLFNRK